MIQPVNSGRGLLDEIEQAGCPSPMLWWLGQSGFAIKHEERIVYIDPYLSESLTAKYKDTNKPHIRMTECPLNPAEITHADLILSTHKHSDHLDPGTIHAMMNASPRAILVLRGDGCMACSIKQLQACPSYHCLHVQEYGSDTCEDQALNAEL